MFAYPQELMAVLGTSWEKLHVQTMQHLCACRQSNARMPHSISSNKSSQKRIEDKILFSFTTSDPFARVQITFFLPFPFLGSRFFF